MKTKGMVLKETSRVLPSKQDHKGAQGNSSGPPHRPLPPPTGQSRVTPAHRGGQGPPRDERLLKKHQYSNNLSSLSSDDYEDWLAAAMCNPRFQELWELEPSDDSSRQRFFDLEF